MTTRTWPFGFALQASVVTVFPGGHSPETPKCTLLKDNLGEGHVLMGITHDIPPVKGKTVKMVFTEGGPNGGYFKITEELPCTV